MNQVAVKEKPILFSGPMVRAILEGRKTQTRRIVKKLDPDRLSETMTKAQWQLVNRRKPESFGVTYFCPYGQPGDRLWVRETHKVLKTTLVGGSGEYEKEVRYKADEKSPHAEVAVKLFGGWKPSIHMPRWASRIDLEIVKIRVERLQDISEEDALAEGILIRGACGPENDYSMTEKSYIGAAVCKTPKKAFESFWNSLNGAGSWNANPWVWVIEFKRIRP